MGLGSGSDKWAISWFRINTFNVILVYPGLNHLWEVVDIILHFGLMIDFVEDIIVYSNKILFYIFYLSVLGNTNPT